MPKPIAGVYNRSLYTLIMVLIVALIASVTLTRAQGPQSATASAASELQASLSAEQKQAISAVMRSYSDDLTALAEKMAIALAPTASAQERLYLPLIIGQSRAAAVVSGVAQSSASASQPDLASVGAALDSVTPELQSLQAGIEQELAGILSAEQLSLYRAAVATAAPTDVEVSAVPQQVTVDALLCFNAAQWSNYGFAYITSAKAFAIMNAFNVDFGRGTPAALQSYISYNEAESYAVSGLSNLSTASVMITAADVQVQNINGGTLFGVKGDTAIKLAESRNTLAAANALLDYEASGGTLVNGAGFGGNYFAYFSYAYGVIANFYLDETISRTPNCY
jgi:hypothetical protein